MGPVGVRNPWVPQHGVQNRPLYINLGSKTAPVYLNLGLCTSTWALYAQHEANLGHFGTILEPSWDHFEATWGSSVACFFVLRFSAFRALGVLLLLCWAAVSRDKGAHAKKNTLKYVAVAPFGVKLWQNEACPPLIDKQCGVLKNYKNRKHKNLYFY